MADEYIFEINVEFTIEVEHVFSKDELEEAGDFKTAMEIFRDDLNDELTNGLYSYHYSDT